VGVILLVSALTPMTTVASPSPPPPPPPQPRPERGDAVGDAAALDPGRKLRERGLYFSKALLKMGGTSPCLPLVVWV
jgi:hypothetical protein